MFTSPFGDLRGGGGRGEGGEAACWGRRDGILYVRPSQGGAFGASSPPSARFGGRYAMVQYPGEGESVLLPVAPSGLSSSSLVGRHVNAAPCPSSSFLELRVPVAGSPHQ
jgi:hypothetical protein